MKESSKGRLFAGLFRNLINPLAYSTMLSVARSSIRLTGIDLNSCYLIKPNTFDDTSFIQCGRLSAMTIETNHDGWAYRTTRIHESETERLPIIRVPCRCFLTMLQARDIEGDLAVRGLFNSHLADLHCEHPLTLADSMEHGAKALVAWHSFYIRCISIRNQRHRSRLAGLSQCAFRVHVLSPSTFAESLLEADVVRDNGR